MTIQHKQTKNEGVFFVSGDDNQNNAELVYTERSGTLMALHTEVDKSLRGQNVGNDLVEALVAHARSEGFKIVPVCPFVKAVIEKKKEFADVLAG